MIKLNLPDIPFFQQKEIYETTPITGGDINEAVLIQTNHGSYFLKYHENPPTKDFLKREAQGLQLLKNTQAIRIPEILAEGSQNQIAYLVLDYITLSFSTPNFWKRFGQQLAQLHRCTQPEFGLDHANFIGSLPQINGYHSEWTDFYIHERLHPQLILARENDRADPALSKKMEVLYLRLPDLCPTEPPALIHGDLWSGNFLIDEHQQPVLIDPSVSYGHREMDLAMTRLFGGFSPTFYQTYQDSFPLAPGFEDRLEIYQLYYLLVHLNLFGRSYLSAVERIVDQFS